MSEHGWVCPGADGDGFVPFRHLKRLAAEMSRDRFVREFPVPALRVVDDVALASREPANRVDSGVRLLTETVQSAAILRYLTRVAFITKRPGNPFPHLVSIGRAATNDIAVRVDSVSKVHGYFVPEGESWSFTDHGSTIGSMINGQVLAAGEHYPLSDGDRLQLGLEVVLEFLAPESLHRKARDAAEHGGIT